MKYDDLRKLESTARENVSVTRDVSLKKNAKPAAAPKKRGIFFTVLIQAAVAAAVIGALALLKLSDGGFAAEVFQGFKDIVSYNYEIADGVYNGSGATLVNGFWSLFS